MATTIHTNSAGNDTSNVNTVLIVILIIAAAAFAIWYFGYRQPRAVAPAQNSAGLNLEVTLPSGGTANGGGTTANEQPAP